MAASTAPADAAARLRGWRLYHRLVRRHVPPIMVLHHRDEPAGLGGRGRSLPLHSGEFICLTKTEPASRFFCTV